MCLVEFLSGNIFCHESGSFNRVNPFRAFGLRVRTLDHWYKRGNLEAEVKLESYEGPFQDSVKMSIGAIVILLYWNT